MPSILSIIYTSFSHKFGFCDRSAFSATLLHACVILLKSTHPKGFQRFQCTASQTRIGMACRLPTTGQSQLCKFCSLFLEVNLQHFVNERDTLQTKSISPNFFLKRCQSTDFIGTAFGNSQPHLRAFCTRCLNVSLEGKEN